MRHLHTPSTREAFQKHQERMKLTHSNIQHNTEWNSNHLVKNKLWLRAGVWIPSVPFHSLPKTFTHHLGALSDPRCFCGESSWKTGMFSCHPWNLGYRAVAIFSFFMFFLQMRSSTTQPAHKVKSWVKLHSIYETRWRRKSIASHLQPLFNGLAHKALPLPSCKLCL